MAPGTSLTSRSMVPVRMIFASSMAPTSGWPGPAEAAGWGACWPEPSSCADPTPCRPPRLSAGAPAAPAVAAAPPLLPQAAMTIDTRSRTSTIGSARSTRRMVRMQMSSTTRAGRWPPRRLPDAVPRSPVPDGSAGIVPRMPQPFEPPLEPMLAKAVDGLPSDDGWLFEPKWDGFRAIVFRDGDAVFTQSRDLKPLDRYFPELAAPLKAALPERCVVDGEVVISRDGALDFEALLLRIHPAASRVNMLAAESPASFVAWDLLALGDEDLRAVPQGERRARLETVLGAA